MVNHRISMLDGPSQEIPIISLDPGFGFDGPAASSAVDDHFSHRNFVIRTDIFVDFLKNPIPCPSLS